ncbi:MAG: fumarate hydratase [Akkermansiaceae bacterium]|jgi:fumarate hydratase, class I|nr:fumarate hydratase [Akkermansiaceae bacterium]MDP4646386.1 fumarate hydratase [Akkermansiaceae bacterium]MDP4779989.1 fumarate hydratase [Akkermansiaceae bacterium]MDP4847085.1 fumarate hydratase [Akkermansiaceae bacterium]MDP4897210.1 fumarate hydratase [Akkermansiaceae bacterium]
MSDKEFFYQDPFPLGADETEYECIRKGGTEVAEFGGKGMLVVKPEDLTLLAQEAIRAINFTLRSSHLAQVAAILDDPEASKNDQMVALMLLKNATIAAHGILPACQDTGTATIIGKKGQRVWTGCDDAEFLTKGIYNTYIKENLRYSQTAPLNMYDEVNTKTNLPAQIDLYATEGDEYKFLFVSKGGGSANKTFLYQETKALLNPKRLVEFCVEKMKTLGTAACPPYHLGFVIGGTSAENNLKTVKMATTRYYDALPTSGNEHGQAFRDLELEKVLLEKAREIGIGAQFGGKYFALDVRVVRLPRHGASCPVGIGVSCSADRQAKAKITKDGIFLEKLEKNPGRFIPEKYADWKFKGVEIDLDQGMEKTLETLSKYPVTTALALSGTIIVARDSAHAKMKEILEETGDLPEYFKKYPVYYAGPAKTPEGMASGSFGPTTAGRMDGYVDLFQSHGGSMVMLAKGNRSQQVTDACKKHGGFYLGSAGGPAALLAQDHIRSQEVVAFPELGMEAVWKITVENFPAFILVDNKGNDFFQTINQCPVC